MNESTIGVTNRRKTWGFIVEVSLLESTLSQGERALYQALFSFAGKNGDSCYPSIEKLAQRAACCKATVFRTLNELEKKGIVKRTHRFRKNGGQTSTMYDIYDSPESYLYTNVYNSVDNSVNNFSHPPSQFETGGGLQIETGIKCAFEEGESQNDMGGISNCNGRGSQIEAQNIYQKEEISKEEKDKDTSHFVRGSEVGQKAARLLSDEQKNETVGKNAQLPLGLATETSVKPKEIRNPAGEIPSCMRHVADYFLLKTGREAMTSDDVAALKELERNHSPIRIIGEIESCESCFDA